VSGRSSSDETLLRELEELVRRRTCWIEPARLRQWLARVRRDGSPLLGASAETLVALIEQAATSGDRQTAASEALRATAQLRSKLLPVRPTEPEAVGLSPPLPHVKTPPRQQTMETNAELSPGEARETLFPRPLTAVPKPAPPITAPAGARQASGPGPARTTGGMRSASKATAPHGGSEATSRPVPALLDIALSPLATVARASFVPTVADGTTKVRDASAASVANPHGNAKPAGKAKKSARTNQPLTLTTPVSDIRGITANYATVLEKAGLSTARDLLFHMPRRYDDYSHLLPIAALRPGMDVTIQARVARVDAVLAKKVRRVVAMLSDPSDQITAVWFNQRWISRDLHVGDELFVSGRVDSFGGKRQLNAPQFELVASAGESLHTGRLVPVYPLTAGITNRWLRGKIKFVVDELAPGQPDPLPAAVRQRWRLPRFSVALAEAHFPTDVASRDRARHRLAFDTALLRQLALQQRKLTWKREQPGAPLPLPPTERDRFEQSLPFALTGAQRRVVDEILADLASGTPMARLLQGDVGSGKTVVAAIAAFCAMHHGYQVALMAPTEILAEQHFKTLTGLFQEYPELHVELLTGSTPAAAKRATMNRAATGQSQFIVGTHAVIQEKVAFFRLGLAIIDEQHRFGVLQRGMLQQKGFNPHLLVMSATPIPRTLERARYADLDVSIIDELPPGRTPVKTRVVLPDRRQAAYAFVRQQVAEGRQVFVICPLVEDSEVIEARAATSEYDRLRTDVFPELRLALLHGRMRPSDKDHVMRAFRDREFDILVSTTVIEVGIDVPNASVMMIEGAERFGLSQLHQLRGRVGRGAHESYCMLLPGEHIEEATQRLRIVERTSDGFSLAEQDLKLRGPGEFYGVRQSGQDEYLDTETITEAHEAAAEILAIDPDLRLDEHQLLATLAGDARERLVDFN